MSLPALSLLKSVPTKLFCESMGLRSMKLSQVQRLQRIPRLHGSLHNSVKNIGHLSSQNPSHNTLVFLLYFFSLQNTELSMQPGAGDMIRHCFFPSVIPVNTAFLTSFGCVPHGVEQRVLPLHLAEFLLSSKVRVDCSTSTLLNTTDRQYFVPASWKSHVEVDITKQQGPQFQLGIGLAVCVSYTSLQLGFNLRTFGTVRQKHCLLSQTATPHSPSQKLCQVCLNVKLNINQDISQYFHTGQFNREEEAHSLILFFCSYTF